MLSLVAAVFLPFGFVTGLQGINVGGVPEAESPMASALVSMLLIMIAGLQAWVRRA